MMIRRKETDREPGLKVTTLHPAPVAPSEGDRWHGSYADLESEVQSLTRMARLAELQLYQSVGGLSFKDGEYTAPPAAEGTELAVFAVQRMADMAKKFEELYYSAFKPLT